MAVDPGSPNGWCPRSRRVCVPLDVDEPVRVDGQPRPHLAIRPADADLCLVCGSQTEVDPAQGAAAVPATDRQLTLGGRLAVADLDPCPDRIAVRPGLREPQLEPGTKPRGRVAACAARVPPDRDRLPVIDLHEVEQPVAVEVRQGRAPPTIEGDDPGLV